VNTPVAASPLPLKGAPPADRQSRIRGGRLVIAWLVAATLGACAVPEPWVKPYERERLADPIMRLNRDALSAKHSAHVRDISEAARGATGVQGGGCGCK